MNTPPPISELDPGALSTLLSTRWGLPPLALTYQALGFGSHHWRADADDSSGDRWFITVDERGGIAGSVGGLERAMRTAAAVKALGPVAEVIAPIPNRDGAMIAPLHDGRWAVAVYPWIEAEPSRFGAFASEADRGDVQRLVAQIHAATPRVPAGLPRRDDLAIPHRDDLEAALTQLEDRWTAGPFAEPARSLLQDSADAVTRALAAYDQLVQAVLADPAPWVITHGEPHAGNIVRLRDGVGLAIVDWDTCALAPRERDLWQLLPADGDPDADLAAYREIAGDAAISTNALALYRLWWDLCEVAIYTQWFSTPHQETGDMRIGFGGLRESLANLVQGFTA